jgi:hypothetical protein
MSHSAQLFVPDTFQCCMFAKHPPSPEGPVQCISILCEYFIGPRWVSQQRNISNPVLLQLFQSENPCMIFEKLLMNLSVHYNDFQIVLFSGDWQLWLWQHCFLLPRRSTYHEHHWCHLSQWFSTFFVSVRVTTL